jgi:nucleoside-diphosphate-sugar epimerase
MFFSYSYGAGGEDEEVIVVSESSPTGDAENSPRIDRLMRAEQAVLKAGGCCLRLAGLYNLSRGAHNFWLTQGKVAGSASGIINLLHYDDAASACLAAIRAGMRSKVFLLSDGNPLTRQEICAAALRARMYQGYSMPEFSLSGEEGRHGKVYETRVTSEQLHWSPKYASFQSYMESKS